jgi:hypothetical protein
MPLAEARTAPGRTQPDESIGAPATFVEVKGKELLALLDFLVNDNNRLDGLVDALA